MKRAVVLLSACLWFMLQLAATPAYACSPAPPTPWFIEELSAAPTKLPSGVTLRTHRSRTITLANSSSRPIYVIGKLDVSNRRYEELGIVFPRDTGPLHRLENGQVYNWGPWLTDSDGPPKLTWYLDDSTPSVLEIEAWPNYIGTGRGTVATVKPRNQVGDNRPSNPTVPAPQHTQITLVYKGLPFVVPLTVSYRLNAAYEPSSVSRASRACARTAPIFCFAIVGLLGTLAAIAGGVRILRWVVSPGN